MRMQDERFICIGGLYPKAGVDGVLGTPVRDNKEVASYRDALSLPEKSDAAFIRLTRVPDEAKKHLQPGDIVCKHNGLEEPFLDVLREKQTSMFVSKNSIRLASIDQDLNDRVRQRAIENHEWAVEADAQQLAISDPLGRLAVVFWYPGSIVDICPCMYRAFPKRDSRWKMQGIGGQINVEGDKTRAAAFEVVYRFIHRAFFDIGASVDGVQWNTIKRRLSYIYEMAKEFARSSTVRVVVPKKKGVYRKPFWSRLGRICLTNPDAVSPLMKRVLEANINNKLYFFCSREEAEEGLQYMLWKEWKQGYKPFFIDDLVPLRKRDAF